MLCVTGQVIYTALASDDDRSPPNNEVLYSIQSGADNHFTIDSQTGEVKVAAKVDRDQSKEVYTLVIVAHDKGTPSLSNQLSLNIQVNQILYA